MRRLKRRDLTATTLATLEEITKDVTDAVDSKAEAKKRWASKPGAAFSEIRTTLESMATGRARCMYCEDSLGTDIDHFWPKADYPASAFKWLNYLLACSHCNSNLKRDQFPLANGEPELIDPTAEDPATQLMFIPGTGDFLPIGAKGQPSIDVFGLNDRTTPRKLPQARRGTFLKLQLLLLEFDRLSAEGRVEDATLTKTTILDEPFSAVLSWLIDVAARPNGTSVLLARVPEVMEAHAVGEWL